MAPCETNTIKLRPFLIRPFGDEYFRVMRWGGDSKIVTRALGVEALRHLKQGLSVREVRSRLADAHGVNSAQINIRPLLESLSTADLIAKVDDAPVPVRKQVTPRTLAKFVWAMYGNPAVRALAGGLRPISAARFALEAIERLDMHRLFLPALQDARRNMDLVLGPCSAKTRARRMRLYYRHLLLNIVDLDILTDGRPSAVCGWIRRSVRLTGLTALEQARRADRGVILAVFHFSSPRLLPVILSLNGLSSVAIGPPNLGIGLQRTSTMFRSYDSLPGCGPIGLLPGFDIARVRALLARLQRGENAICMADVFSPSADTDSEGAKFFGQSSSGFSNGTTCVALGRHAAHFTSWIGWLASVSGARVVPVLILRRPDHGLDVVFEKSIAPAGNGKASEIAVNRALYATFGSYLAKYPEQWFPWRILHRFSLHEAEQTDCQSVPSGFARDKF